jgi:cytochrome P450
MTAPSTADIDFDPFAPRPFEELPPIWAELRDRAPVYRTPADMYVVTRYDDVRGIQRRTMRLAAVGDVTAFHRELIATLP